MPGSGNILLFVIAGVCVCGGGGYVCVCVCVCDHHPVSPHSDVNHMVEIAEAVQTRLDAYKADKRDLGTVISP